MRIVQRSRIGAASVAVLATALALVGHAAPAAAVSSATVVISSGFAVTPSTVSLAAGDTLTIQNDSFSGLSVVNGTGQIQSQMSSTNCASAGASSPAASCPLTSGPSATSFNVMATGTVLIYRYAPGATVIATVTIGSGGGGGTSSGSAVSAPPPIIQQVGMPSGGCSAVVDADLNWAGVAAGGWGQSWAQWANGGNGGPVCTRTLSYSVAADRWVAS